MEQHTIFIDSRERSSGTDSAFEVTLRESVHLQSHRLRVDHCRVVDSCCTTDLGKDVYYKAGSGGLQYFALPEQAYTGPRLAVALQTATGRTTTSLRARTVLQGRRTRRRRRDFMGRGLRSRHRR